MKTTFILVLTLMMSLIATSQTLEDAKKFIYYERYKSAENVLKNTLKTDPGNAEGWYLLSQAYLLSDNADSLRAILLQSAPEVKNQPFYQVAYGHLLLSENKKDSARYYFEQALDKTKDKDPEILSAIANAHINTKVGDAGYAIELLEKAIKKDKKNAALNTLEGDAYRKTGNGSEAYKAYTAALEKDNQFAAAQYRMGKIFVSQKNSDMYLKYFKQAIQADSNYAPALYEMYYHYYFTDAQKAMAYFQDYLTKSDFKKINAYRYVDLLYLTEHYKPAIDIAQNLLTGQAGDSIPRLYKLVAYSYLGLKDTGNAISFMNLYFAKEADSNLVSKDFETMAELYSTVEGKKDSAIAFYLKTAEKIKDTNDKYRFYKKLSDLYKDQKDYANQAKWLGMYYQNNPNASNLDLFNWGIANFKAESYVKADTVFGLYTQKYPDQAFGYYWRARVNSLRDSAMEKGLAVPHYNQLIEMLEKDTTDNKTNKKWLVESYGYLAAYETNEVKDYKTAIEKLKKILEIDPENKDAQQYISTLEKKISSDKDTGSNR